MIVNINISVELTQIEITFLRKYFDKNPDKIINPHFSLPGNKAIMAINEEKSNFDSLIKKDILKMDSIGNATLTTLGKLIIEKIDRGNIIDDLLN